jgi:hypothetical protein
LSLLSTNRHDHNIPSRRKVPRAVKIFSRQKQIGWHQNKKQKAGAKPALLFVAEQPL